MPDTGYEQLDNFVYYGDSLETVQKFEWFDSFPFDNTKQFYFVLRSIMPERTLRKFLMELFPKIFSFDMFELGLIGESVMMYGLTFSVHYDDFWDDVSDKLFLYTMSILNTAGFELTTRESGGTSDFINNVMICFENEKVNIKPEKFFDSGIANLVLTVKSINKNHYIPLWGSIESDLNAIKFILSSPRNFRAVLLKVPTMDCTTITHGITEEFNQMRRTL